MNLPGPDNPYATPVSDPASPTAAEEAADVRLGDIAREVFLQWEKLRLFYNGFLVLWTLVIAGGQVLTLGVLKLAIPGAIFVNLCYFIGPALETYVRWLGYRGKWLRWALFVAGTLFAGMLALAALATEMLPDQ